MNIHEEHQRKNNKPLFLVCSIVLIIFAVLFFAWVSINKKNTTSTNTDNDNSNQPNTVVDKYFEWLSYCSPTGDLCFKYPKDWIVGSSTSANATTITNPSNTIQILYTPVITEIGGFCEINTCFFKAISIQDLSNPGLSGLKIVKGVFTNKSTDSILAECFVSSNDRISEYNLSVNENIDVGFFTPLISSPLNSAQIEELRIKRIPDQDFGSEQEAIMWLSEIDSITAESIMESVYINQ